MRVEDELKKGIEEYTQSAIRDESENRRRSAATMYFKAIAAVCDYIIYFKLKRLPDNHTERFRILETHFQAYYSVLNKVFPIYQQTYRSDINQEQLEMVKNGLKKLKELAGLE